MGLLRLVLQVLVCLQESTEYLSGFLAVFGQVGRPCRQDELERPIRLRILRQDKSIASYCLLNSMDQRLPGYDGIDVAVDKRGDRVRRFVVDKLDSS